LTQVAKNHFAFATALFGISHLLLLNSYMENIQPKLLFSIPLCLYLVQKYEKNAVANDKC
jgi:hypothetical protein